MFFVTACDIFSLIIWPVQIYLVLSKALKLIGIKILAGSRRKVTDVTFNWVKKNKTCNRYYKIKVGLFLFNVGLPKFFLTNVPLPNPEHSEISRG